MANNQIEKFGLRTVAGFMIVLASTAHATDREQPTSIQIGSSEFAGWWKAEARTLVDWTRDGPVMTGLECTASHDRDGTPMQLTVLHPTESSEFRYSFHFNLKEGELIDRKVESITVGGRPYQLKSVQSRIGPWIGGSAGIVLPYGLGREMFRPNETYPWLPIEFLIPQFFEAEGIFLGTAGEFEVEHGEYERRFGSIYIDMDGFKDAMLWCYNRVNPNSKLAKESAANLREELGKQGEGGN